MVLLSLLLIVQVGIVVRDALALGVVGRHAAREAVVTGSSARTASAIRDAAGPLDVNRIQWTVSPSPGGRQRGQAVTITLTYVEPVRIPVVDRFVTRTVTLHSTVTMRLETSDPTPTPGPSP